jgi:hypothetical protein
MRKTPPKKPVINELPKFGEKVDEYLIRQLNANPNSLSTDVIDECVKLLPKAKVIRAEFPGKPFGPEVETAISIWWNREVFRFKKENGRWGYNFGR